MMMVVVVGGGGGGGAGDRLELLLLLLPPFSFRLVLSFYPTTRKCLLFNNADLGSWICAHSNNNPPKPKSRSYLEY